jgi:phosphoribosylformylglycinamidine cyclo-ligase
MNDKMTYAGVGVDYDAMDPFKRMAQLAGRETAGNIARLNNGEFVEFEASRGESAFLIEAAKSYVAHVEEGLGTKNLVADAMYELTGVSYYDHIAQCTVAMIVNDMITLGALPLSVAMHLAVGVSDWFKDEKRCKDLVTGWKKACDLARCVWGGGETPTLKGVVVPEAVVLSGSAIGFVKPKERLIWPDKIQHGDAIIIIESSGIHANGLTLAREIAARIPDGYLTFLSDGRSYGKALLDSTRIYVPVVEDCLNAGVDIHYAVNVTGHGWRKLMRAPQPFAYIIETLPKQLPIFDFIQKHGPVDDREAYGNLNMGAGFVFYVSEADVKKVWAVLESYESSNRFGAVYAGHIENSDARKVVIKPKDLKYLGSTLGVR